MKPLNMVICVVSVFLLTCSSNINFLSGISGESVEIPEFRKDPQGNFLGAFQKTTLIDEFPVFKQYKDLYHPDQTIVKELNKYVNDVAILIVLGTWCSDSERFVGEFLKVQDELNGKFDLLLIGIDSKKSYPDEIIQKFDIQKVPTFIVYRKGKEIGRIIEKPLTSIEMDLLTIVTK